MTEPKVVRWGICYPVRGPQDAMPHPTGRFVEYNDYEALQARVQELEDNVREGVEAQVRYVAENKRLREALEMIPDALKEKP